MVVMNIAAFDRWTAFAWWKTVVVAVCLLMLHGCGDSGPSDAEVKDNLVERWPELVAAAAAIPGSDSPDLVNSFVYSHCFFYGGSAGPGILLMGQSNLTMPIEEARKALKMTAEAWRDLGHPVQATEKGADSSLLLSLDGAAGLWVRIESVEKDHDVGSSLPDGQLEVRIGAEGGCALGYSPELLPGYP